MKKLLPLLALVLAVMLPVSALASTVTQVYTLPVDGDFAMLDGGMLTNADYRTSTVWLVDETGAPISEAFADITRVDGHLALFSVSEEFNTTGLMDSATGRQIVPPTYGTVEILSDNWYAGVTFAISEDDDYDYFDFRGNHFDCVQVDLFYKEQPVATLTAAECGRINAYGDYVVSYTGENVIWVNKAGEKSFPGADRDFSYEFDTDFHTGVITHNPTAQQAFVADCTLTADEVRIPVQDTKDGIIDLQGNVIIAQETLPEGAYLSTYADGWMLLACHDKETNAWRYTAANRDASVMLPFELAELPTLSLDHPWFIEGVLPAITADGKMNVYDATGALLSSTQLPEGVQSNQIKGFYYCSTFMVIDGDAPFVISATAGQLDVSAYEDVYYSSYNGHKLLPVKQNGLWGCIDLSGELVIPCVFRYEPAISTDSTRVLGRVINEEGYTVYTLYVIGD